MLLPRIIPSLLISNDDLVKTRQFKDSVYLGDVLNAVRIFSEKRADEIVIFDINASVKNSEPNFKLLEKIARQSKVPVCYGGGIKNLTQALKILKLGVEKIALSSVIWENAQIVKEISEAVGRQSVVCVLDVKKNNQNNFEIYSYKATKKINIDLEMAVQIVDENGAGEIIINSIDRDGTMEGYNHDVVRLVQKHTDLPITILGGAGSIADVGELFSNYGIIGAAAGSLFVFKGRNNAVLINYPSPLEKQKIIAEYYENPK